MAQCDGGQSRDEIVNMAADTERLRKTDGKFKMMGGGSSVTRRPQSTSQVSPLQPQPAQVRDTAVDTISDVDTVA